MVVLYRYRLNEYYTTYLPSLVVWYRMTESCAVGGDFCQDYTIGTSYRSSLIAIPSRQIVRLSISPTDLQLPSLHTYLETPENAQISTCVKLFTLSKHLLPT